MCDFSSGCRSAHSLPFIFGNKTAQLCAEYGISEEKEIEKNILFSNSPAYVRVPLKLANEF